MKAEVMEKQEGCLIVKFTATNGAEGIMMGAAQLASTDDVSLEIKSDFYGQNVTFGYFKVPVIEQLTTKKEKQ